MSLLFSNFTIVVLEHVDDIINNLIFDYVLLFELSKYGFFDPENNSKEKSNQ